MQAPFLLMFALFLGGSAPGFAATMEGKCFEKTKANFDNKIIDGRTFKCSKGGWTTVGSGADTADSNGFMQIYVDEGRSRDPSIELKFRPRRSSECLTGVYNANRKPLASSSSDACATDHKTTVMMNIDQRGRRWTAAAGAVTTTSKQHGFSVMYMQGTSLGIARDTDYYLVGVFIESN